MTKDRVLDFLWSHADESISGEELAARLELSRTAVWKAVDQLRGEGYLIESAPRRGYRLLSKSDVLSEAGIRKYLNCPELRLRCFAEIGSTNTALKELANRGEAAGLALVAGRQTAGRGRMGRSFFSPEDSGVYLSLLLRPSLPASEATAITACAAVAVAESIEALSNRAAQIKWVNDIFVDGRKVCGILTEASVDCESGMMHHVIIGIGVNTRVPDGDFPEELRGIAGAAFGAETVPELRCRLAAAILDRLMDYTPDPAAPAVFEGYKKRSLVLGKDYDILAPGREPEPAVALDLNEDYSLLVRLPDGSTRRLNSGEVSVKL